MNSKDLLAQIYREQKVTDENNTSHPLHSNIDIEEGTFITDIIKKFELKKTIEIGCAQGLSSLYICQAIADKPEASHTMVDPNQKSQWSNIGLHHLKTAGFNFFELVESPSELALPELVKQKKEYDFGFIDGWHTFDHTLIDFFYLNRLIKKGGVIIIDDVGMPAVKKAVRYILNYPGYKLVGSVTEKVTTARRILHSIQKIISIISKILPEKVAYELFSSNLIKSDKKLKINASMVAFQKVEEDTRPWNWYENF